MDDTDDPFADLCDVVTSADELGDVIGTPPEIVAERVLTALDPICRAFIAASPFCLIGSVGADGHVDVSPKGDPAGFVKVLSDTRLAIPDRPGNRRADTFHNVLETDHVGLIFIIPGRGDTLRIRGRARIVRDPALCATMAVAGKAPNLALVVHVEEAFMHCAKSITRSRLWQAEAWPAVDHLPSFREATLEHAKRNETLQELQTLAEQEGLTRLY